MKGEWIINGTVYYHSGYYRDLSDHYPVIQSFVLEATTTTTTVAASHDDEALRPFRWWLVMPDWQKKNKYKFLCILKEGLEKLWIVPLHRMELSVKRLLKRKRFGRFSPDLFSLTHQRCFLLVKTFARSTSLIKWCSLVFVDFALFFLRTRTFVGAASVRNFAFYEILILNDPLDSLSSSVWRRWIRR